MDVQKVSNGTQESMIRSMLNLKGDELIPDFVLERFLKIKKLLNRIDGRLTASVMAEALLSLGFDPDLNSFDGTPAEVAKLNVEAPVEPEPEAPAEPEEPEVFPDEIPHNILADGTKVSFSRNGEPTIGEIVGNQVVDEDVFYDVEIEGEDAPVMIAGDEIEVV